MKVKNTLSNVLIFTVGAAIGSAVTWYFVKTKYEQLAQEEINSVKEEFANRDTRIGYEGPQDADEAEKVEVETIIPHATPEDVKKTCDELIRKHVYRNYSDVEPTLIDVKNQEVAPREEVSDVDGPKVINPEEFGELDYKIVELTYWADGVLTDTKNKVIQDVDALIGKGSLDRFGEYEEDALHIRDDEKKLYFEILRDLKKYRDFFDSVPHQAEDE